MSTLITISCSWHDSAWLYEKLAFASPGDSILLLQDAVLALHSPITLASFIAKCEAIESSVYSLQEDVCLRGVDSKYAQIQSIDYAGFVGLVTKHDKHLAW